MKKTALLICVLLCAVLCGCSSWMDGSYASVEPYLEQGVRPQTAITAVSNYQQLRMALADMVENAVESRTLSVADMDPTTLENDLRLAVHYAASYHPIGAYAVDKITYERGTTGGTDAVVINVEYNHNRGEITRMRHVDHPDQAAELVESALNQVSTGLVLHVSNYKAVDYEQLVQDYAMEYPEKVMEVPQVAVNVYPELGSTRVVELSFVYQTSRETLKTMQQYVQPKFSSASMYVLGEEQTVKYMLLYALLMETADYTVETSITPAYSLLRHYVGDSKAFATVYASMCRRAGVACLVVSGTRAGEPWFWNMIEENGVYYHVDLLRCSQSGGYQTFTDADMAGYVWDYDAYPACGPVEEIPDGTDPDDNTHNEDAQQETTAPDSGETDGGATENTEPEQTVDETEGDQAETTAATEETEDTAPTEESETTQTTENSEP